MNPLFSPCRPAVEQPQCQFLAHVPDALGRKGYAGQDGQGLSLWGDKALQLGVLVVTSVGHTCLAETFKSIKDMCFPKTVAVC